MRPIDRIDTELDLESVPYLRDLDLAGVQVVPAAVILEIATATAAIVDGQDTLTDIDLPAPVVHGAGDEVHLVAELYEDRHGAHAVSLHRADWDRTVHVHAVLAPGSSEEKTADPVPLDEIQSRCARAIGHDRFYAMLTDRGIRCGAALSGVDIAWHGSQEMLAVLRADVPEADSDLYRLHPVMVEAALQPAFALVDPHAGGGWYFAGIGRFEICREGATVVWTHVVRTDGGLPGEASFDVRLFDEERHLVAELTGVRVRAFTAGELPPPRFAPPSGDEIRRMPMAERVVAVGETVRRWLSEIMRLDTLDPGRELRAYGIDSFMGMELRALLQRHWYVDLPLAVIFDGASVNTLVAEIVERVARRHEQTIQRGLSHSVARLSRGQEALWSIHRFAAESAAYHVVTALNVLSPLDVRALAAAWRAVVARHEVLSATFGEDTEGPFYRKDARVDFAVVDARGVADFDALLADEADRPFVLTEDAPVRLRVYERAGDKFVLLMCAHHIVVDMWSCVVALEELALEYGGAAPAAAPAVEYADFAEWQRGLLAEPDGDRLWEYWRERLSGELPVLALPADRPRPGVQSFRGANRQFGVSRKTSARLVELGARLGVTPFVVLLAVYQLWLHRETRQNRVVVGSPTAGRGRPEIDNVVGYFINPLPMIADFAPGMSFVDVLVMVNDAVVGAFEHEDFPMAEMVERLAPVRDSSYSPLYQTMFVMQRAQAFDKNGFASLSVGVEGAPVELGSLVVEPVVVERRWSMFDLTWMVAESADGFLVSVDYSTNLFDEATVDRFLGHFQTLLEGVGTEPERPVEEIPMLTGAEVDAVRVWNATEVDFGVGGCVHEGVWAAGDRRPDAVAVIAQDGVWTYRELLGRAARIGWWLRSAGVRPNELVGICLEKGVDQVAAVLGVVASGAAYLPLDPGLPAARLAELIDLGRVTHLVTGSTVDLPGVTVLSVDDPVLGGFSDEMPDVVQLPSDLAYVIFTSGSTGVPKGVMIDHVGVLNTVVDVNQRFGVIPEDRVFGLASLSFDLSVYDIFGPLSAGAALVLPAPEGVKDPSHWVELVREHRVTVWDSVPMLLQLLVEAQEASGEALGSLRVGLLSGDWVPVSLPEKVWALNPEMRIFSGGGATEASIWSIMFPVTEVDPSWTSIPYGRPMTNQRFYVMDEAQQVCPVGVAGELCIGGVGVARGYWGDEKQTAERFIQDPFSDDPRALLYRTGDLGRWRADGVIEFLGRVDHQVKIRGFRVELGEIDAVLTAHEGVSEAVTVVHGGRLASYVVAGDALGLREWVRSRLPDYMVPAAVTVVDRLPLSSNGKVDRAALPEPVWQTAEEFVQAQSDKERILAEIWAETLGLDQVGVLDNFFTLGGDSILSIQMVSRAAQHGIHLTPAQVFQEQTIARLAEVAGDGPAVLAEQGPVTGPVDLGPVQRWFVRLDLADRNHFNQAVIIESAVQLDPGRVANALTTVVRHHDVLRSRFAHQDETWTQRQLAPEEVDVPVEVLDGTALADAVRAAHSRMDIANGPLVTAVLLDQHQLVLASHHLVIDAVSWRFVLEDFARAYGDLGALPAKTTSFAGWTARLSEFARSSAVTDQAEYWRGIARTIVPLPVDRAGTNTHASGETRRLALPATEVVASARRGKARMDELVLAACAQGLAEWAGRASVTIDVEAHGREPLFDDVDLSRTVGWFTVIRPVHLPVGDEADVLGVVKQALREARDGGIGYGLLREHTDLLTGTPVAPVLFNYLGQVDEPAGSAFSLRMDDPVLQEAAQAPGNVRHHAIEINTGVRDAELVLELTYSTELHSGGSMDELLDAIHQRLKALCGRENIPHTTDFPLAGLDQRALGELMAKMEGNVGAQ